MAIFHLKVASVSRALGQSAVAAWAYISGTRQVDERTGLVHNCVYKAREVLAKGCFGPTDWQACERAERRKDAKVARTIIVALPCELNLHEQASLVSKFARGLRDSHGVSVGWAIHEAPGDARNRHVHLLLTTRRVDDEGRYGAKTRELDVRPESGRVLTCWRGRWTLLVNGALAMARVHAQVCGRSLAARGITRPPRMHLGPECATQHRRGYRTAAARHNARVDDIERANAELDLVRGRIRSVLAQQRRGRVQRQIRQSRRNPRRWTSRPNAPAIAAASSPAQDLRSTATVPVHDQSVVQTPKPRGRGR